MRRPWLLIAAAVVVLVIAGVAKVVWPRRHTLEPIAGSNGVTYVLYTHVPQACRAGGCAALYLLDGAAWLPTFAEIEDDLVAQNRIEPFVIVGIGYGDVINTANLRKFDFTPAFGREPNKTGGADQFLTVLRDQIIPYAEAQLPIDGEGRALAGHSYGGLFAAYALARSPELFDRAIIMSPALWFDDGKIFDVPFAAAPSRRTVFLAADTPREARSDMANDVLRYNTLLAGQSGLEVSRALIVGKDHNSMVAPAARRGLMALFGAEPDQ